MGDEIKWPLIMQFPMCQTINLSQYFNLKQNTPKQIVFKFNVMKNMAVSLSIGDSNFSTNRTLKSQMETYSGPTIEHNNLAIPVIKRFSLRLTQTLDSEDQIDMNCTNYPNDKFSSFKECDENYVLNILNNTFDGIVPFWATRDLGKVTLHRYVLNIPIHCKIDF